MKRFLSLFLSLIIVIGIITSVPVISNAATTYKITYNANGGTGAPSSQTKEKGKTLVLSSKVPERFGYTFQG